MSVPNVAGTFRASALARERRAVSVLPELDRLLPRGGLVAGTLVDFHADEGVGALALALRIAGHGQRQTARTVVYVDATGDFYPQAAAQAGVDLERLVVLRRPWNAGRSPADRRGTEGASSSLSKAEARWLLGCLDEALRSRAVGSVVARVRRLDGPSSHRLRVAAEAGGGLGLFVRPLDERTAVSAAAVRLLVSAREGRPSLEAIRVRGGIASPLLR